MSIMTIHNLVKWCGEVEVKLFYFIYLSLALLPIYSVIKWSNPLLFVITNEVISAYGSLRVEDSHTGIGIVSHSLNSTLQVRVFLTY